MRTYAAAISHLRTQVKLSILEDDLKKDCIVYVVLSCYRALKFKKTHPKILFPLLRNVKWRFEIKLVYVLLSSNLEGTRKVLYQFSISSFNDCTDHKHSVNQSMITVHQIMKI